MPVAALISSVNMSATAFSLAPAPISSNSTAADAPQYMANIQYLLSGYDVLKGNPMPTGEIPLDPGFRQQIFEASYKAGSVSPDQRWFQPDGLTITDCSGTCALSFQAKEIAGESSYQNSLETKVSISGGGWGAKFSASTDFKQVHQGSSEHHSFYTQSEISCCAYTATLTTYVKPPLSANFQAGVATLKGAPQAAYMEFIDSFGTHYLESGTLGALFGQQSAFTESAWSKMSEDIMDIKAAASYSGYGATASASFQSDSDKKTAEKFREASTSQKLYSIGAKPPADNKGLTWAQSAIQSPTPMSMRLAQIDSLVEDAAIAANLSAALSQYCEHLKDAGTVTSCDAPGPDPPFPAAPSPPPSWERFTGHGSSESPKVDMCSHSNFVAGTCPSGTSVAGFQAITANNAVDSCSGSGAGDAVYCSPTSKFADAYEACEWVSFEGNSADAPPQAVDSCSHSRKVTGQCPSGKVVTQMQSVTNKNAWDSCSATGALPRSPPLPFHATPLLRPARVPDVVARRPLTCS